MHLYTEERGKRGEEGKRGERHHTLSTTSELRREGPMSKAAQNAPLDLSHPEGKKKGGVENPLRIPNSPKYISHIANMRAYATHKSSI